MEEHESPEPLVNPCKCSGTAKFVHIKCLQDWIKVKKKMNAAATCLCWKKLFCEICKDPLPDLVEINKQKKEVVPFHRPENPYILLERVFYDKTKETGENSKTMVLLSIFNESNQIKMVEESPFFNNLGERT